jgi:hypothetical protein
MSPGDPMLYGPPTPAMNHCANVGRDGRLREVELQDGRTVGDFILLEERIIDGRCCREVGQPGEVRVGIERVKEEQAILLREVEEVCCSKRARGTPRRMPSTIADRELRGRLC